MSSAPSPDGPSVSLSDSVLASQSTATLAAPPNTWKRVAPSAAWGANSNTSAVLGGTVTLSAAPQSTTARSCGFCFQEIPRVTVRSLDSVMFSEKHDIVRVRFAYE